LEPTLEWTEWEKSVYASKFLREELIPRRAAILQITDEFQGLNQQVLDSHSAEIARLAGRFRSRMQWQVSVSLVLGIVVALWTIRYARRLESRLQAQYEESIAAKTSLQRLSAKVVQAQEDERRAISRELHDQIGQALTAIKVNLGRLEQKFGSAAPELGERIRESKLLAEQMVQEVRDLSRLLRPTMLDDLGLVPALEWYVRNFSRRSGIPVHLNIDRRLGRLPEEWETCIYRTVQEALTNTMRHSEATEVLIELQHTADCLVLTVEDNGQGFELNSPAAGIGLTGMSERARELGGVLAVESKQQAGTRIRIRLPLPPAASTDVPESASSVVS
ncbi:MAG: sensor histidine kinase, partial [Acidobacteria bacterium]|nr:sensor histidine kinase [Acidobacteriota bacterium]